MKTTRFDPVQYLDSDEAIAEYLNVVLEENDPVAFTKAVGTVARAIGMTVIAQQTGLGRQSLYKALSGDNAPKLETMFKVLTAIGVKLSVQAG